MKEDNLFSQEKTKYPNLQLVLASPFIDQPSLSSLQPVNVAEEDKNDDDEDNLPLIWKIKRKNYGNPPKQDTMGDWVSKIFEFEKRVIEKESKKYWTEYMQSRSIQLEDPKENS